MTDSNEEPLLSTKGLTKSYRRRRVVDGVSVHVNAGEIVGLLGPNGAGKTTSFRMVVGMIRPDAGTVEFEGENITKLPMYKRARRGLGYLAQEKSVFQRMTVLDNVLAVLEARRVPKTERMDRAMGLLNELQLEHLLGSYGSDLSGGERRRLEIARALATRPKLLLLDEPFAAIDPVTVQELQRIVVRLAERGIASLITDHNVDATLRITDRSYVLAEGAVIAEGKPSAILANEHVRQVYLGSSFGEGITEEERSGLDLS
ncbi:MAG: LPS export ABC transporter ATP-binding protein [Planctomycetota bacterium]